MLQCLLLLLLRLLLLHSMMLLLLCWYLRLLIIITTGLCNKLLETKHVLRRYTFGYRIEQVRRNDLQRRLSPVWAGSDQRQSLRSGDARGRELVFMGGTALKLMLVCRIQLHEERAGCIELLMTLHLRLVQAIHEMLGLLVAAE